MEFKGSSIEKLKNFLYNTKRFIIGGIIMDNVVIRELYRNSENYFSKEVKVSGWVRTVRDSKTFGFIEINDGSFFKNLQIVFDDTLANFEDICKLTISSSIEVTGTVVKTENAKQPFEIKASDVNIIATAAPEYPLQKKRHTMEYLRNIYFLFLQKSPSKILNPQLKKYLL